jgi:cytoskeletal protein CcmA (bactofilin family)
LSNKNIKKTIRLRFYAALVLCSKEILINMPPEQPFIDDTPENSLEDSKPVVETTPLTGSAESSTSPTASSLSPSSPNTNLEVVPPTNNKAGVFSRLIHDLLNFSRNINIYLLSFIFVVIVAVIIIIIAATTNSTNNSPSVVGTKNLTPDQLQKLSSAQGTSIGSSDQVLTIASSTIFDGQVLAKQDLDVAGSLKLGNQLNAPNLTIPGTATIGSITANKLTLSGNTALAGQLAVGQNLTVGGSSNFAGNVSINQLTVQALLLSGDLQLNHHLTTGGSVPSRSNGNALGGGGTATVSGSDTAGSININTGIGPSPGCFITVNFSTNFATTPHVIVTPIGSAAGGLSYYVQRSSTNFSVCSNNAAPSSSNFGFDYVVLD